MNSNSMRNVFFKVGFMMRSRKVVINENHKIIDTSCSGDNSAMDFYSKISKLVGFTGYNRKICQYLNDFRFRANKKPLLSQPISCNLPITMLPQLRPLTTLIE